MPLNYALAQKSKVLSGAGSVASIGEVVKESGYKKAFVVYDAGIRDFGIAKIVTDALEAAGVGVVTFDKVLPDPPDNIVEEAADLCKSTECDCVVAVGGGSTIDTAKGVTVLRFNPGKILDYAKPDAQMCFCPGLISVPTTSGTGSELSNGIIISDHTTGQKVPIVGYNAMSEAVVLDPELTLGMPAGLTGITGLDVFSHAMEAYTTVLTSPIVAAICEKVMEDVVEFLPRAIANGKNVEARERMLMGASLGGWMLANCCAHVGHSLGHVLGGAFHMPHGAACAYAAPSAIRFIAPVCTGKVKRVGQILGASFNGDETAEQIGEITAAAYKKFRDEVIGLKPLSTFNINADEAIALAPQVAVETFAQFTPRQVTEDAATEMLKEIFA